MLISTARTADAKTKAFAKSFAGVTGSGYAARGKKSVETLVRSARKTGEGTVAVVSNSGISFLSLSTSSWSWKEKFLEISRIMQYFAPRKQLEIETIIGTDAKLFSDLFGIEEGYGGEMTMSAEDGKLRFIRKGKTLLEVSYSVKDFAKKGGEE